MPFDETGRRPGRRPARNVLGGPIGVCSNDPMTGFFRNGCCETSPEDIGSHTVCAVMTAEFLAFSKAQRQRPVHAAAGVWFRRAETGRSLVPVRAALAGGVRGRRGAQGGAALDRGRRVAALPPGRSDAVRDRPGLATRLFGTYLPQRRTIGSSRRAISISPALAAGCSGGIG